jgi:peptidoglycan/xylan/chitin deacetylase (PgdA/CDA1 family)
MTRTGRRWPPILMYHAVARVAEDPNRLCVSPQTFDSQMAHLRDRGLRGVPVRKLRRAVMAGKAAGLVGITFDDGYQDFLEEAVPLLERYGFSATVFAVGGRLGRENDWEHAYEPRPPMKLMTAAGLREASERGMEVGSHSMTHPRLSRSDPEQLREEIVGSRRYLSELLGEDVSGFCYPYGDLDAEALQMARHAGYEYACAWKTRVQHDDYDLFRTPVDEQDDLLRFKLKLRIYPMYASVTRVLR